MRVVSFTDGRALRLVALEEIRPEGGTPINSLMEEVAARYRFQVKGLSPLAQQQGAMAPGFGAGEIEIDGQLVLISNLEFTPGFVSAVCTKTDLADLLLEDLFAFLQDRFGFKPVPAERRTLYRSSLVTELPFEIDRTFGKWLEVQDALNAAHSAEYPDRDIQPFGIKFVVADSNGVVADSNNVFSCERRLALMGETNWTYTSGPFSTADHVKVIEKIETVFS